MQWPRLVEGQPQEPATLILRVEGPAALEIQHKSDVILRAGQPLLRLGARSAGWRCARHRCRSATGLRPQRPPDPKEVETVAKTLSAVEDEELRAALARLGAAIKRN